MTPEKTPRKRSWRVVFLVAVIIGLLVYRAYTYWYWPTATVKITGSTLHVLVADTYEHDVRGLSHRKNLGSYDGMLFYFPSRDQHTMVMRDMLFALDIIWIDRGIVVDIAKNLPPEPAGKSEAELTPYSARAPSTMVLEMPAGKADAYGLQVGDEVVIAR